ncbi:MAG TPA: substrate-binding domain-containing protein [Adhaeribacter sp.]|nr:substrate-binding domain-containing protein [Adhaeribacter sp.]
MKKEITTCVNLLSAAFIALMLGSCNSSGDKKSPTDTPTSGAIKISVDESFQPIIDSQINTFQHLYKYAKVTASYGAEGQVVKDLLQDSARLIVISRHLTPEESSALEKKANISKNAIKVTKIAYDGIALIVHPDNQDTLLSLSELHQIFTGKASSWKQLDPNSQLGDITIVFDNNNSSSVRFVQDSITHNQPLSAKAYASKSNPAVIDYVSQNKNAIGVIGVNWISDLDDPAAIRFTDKVRVVATGRGTGPEAEENYMQPLQAYLAQKKYPLMREVFIISREARAGLGTGFASFVAGDKGQRIVLKSGLVPARGVIRLVQTRQ